MVDPILHNREGRDDFAVRWHWAESDPGITAVLRVKNEARTLPFVLPPLLRAVHRVVLVDNKSDDGTPDLAQDLAQSQGVAEHLEILSYPFSVSRCGPEHLATPEDSLHSLAYYYNWSFSAVHTAYSLKWDGDMVLTEAGVSALRTLSWQTETTEVAVIIPRHPLYVVDEKQAYFDGGFVNLEPFVFPNTPDYTFAKAFDWEVRMTPPNVHWLTLGQGLHFEVKWLDSDEFGNWSVKDIPETGPRQRKAREWAIFEAHTNGDQHPGLVRIEAPAGTHIIDHVRNEWLPRQQLPIVPAS